MCSLESAKASSRLRLSTWLTPASRNHLPGSTTPGSFFASKTLSTCGRPPGRVKCLDLPGGHAASTGNLLINGSLSIGDTTSPSTQMADMMLSSVVGEGPVFSGGMLSRNNSRQRARQLSTWLPHPNTMEGTLWLSTRMGRDRPADRLGPPAAKTLQRHRRLRRPQPGREQDQRTRRRRETKIVFRRRSFLHLLSIIIPS